jgi:ATP-dependent DNA helicase RecG
MLHALDLNEEQMKNFDDLYQRAYTEMAYWEALAYFRQSHAREDHLQKISARPLKIGEHTQKLLEKFPYDLTQGQQEIWNNLSQDLQKTTPLHRLIQGDVGSGKTILGFLALMMAVDTGAQAVFMAPTELLAQQHYEKIHILMGNSIPCLLLTGSVSMSIKKSHYEAISAGVTQIVIGTQAVFQDQVVFANLALVVIDEQQRFGVAQRTKLLHKAQDAAHHLTLTATPIPRTLSQAFFGHMDYCILKEKPQGRLAIKTYTVPGSKREMILRSIQNALAKKHSVYWVCPLIEESETLEVKAAVHSFEQLCQEPMLSEYRIGLLHGKMSGPERQRTLKAFYEQEYHILVSTLVIEVGIDDPKANLIVIESPERLGLAQLHQLRGRVGRGGVQSYCLLIYDPTLSEKGIDRLQALCEHDDGFALAEIDLQMRGPGEFLGAKQSGFQAMKFFNFEKHKHLVEKVPSGLGSLSSTDHSKLDDLFGFNVQKEHWEC